MKLITWFVALLMIFVGNFGIMSSLHEPPIQASQLSIGLVMTAWGGFLLWYSIKSYRGGAATIIGVFLLGLAIHSVIESVFWAELATPKEARSQYLMIVFCALAGLALVKQGHIIHKLISQRSASESPSADRTHQKAQK